MNSIGTGIDTVYQTLLEIQKALGTNENENTASINSLKGALLKLKDIIEEQSKSIEFVEYDESLTMLRTKQWKHIDGTKLIRQWDQKYILATDAIDLYSKYEKYFTKKEFTLYQKTLLSKEKVNENNYLNYFILSDDGFYQSSKGTSFSNDIDYYNITTLEETLDGFGGPEIDNFLVNVLPYYQAVNAEGQLEDYQVDNIFEDVIEYILYDIGHAEPVASINDADNKKYNLLKEENNHSVLSELNVNAKGHVYGYGNTHILPQAIIVENNTALEALNVPIGTFAYVLDEELSIPEDENPDIPENGGNTDSGTETPDDGENTNTFTVTYQYVDSDGERIKNDTTEPVNAGEELSFTITDSRAIIDKYTCISVSPTSAIINEDTIVTYTYTANNEENIVVVTVEMNEDLAIIDEDSNLSVGDNNVQINKEYTLKATINQPGSYYFDRIIVEDTEGNELANEDMRNDSLEYKYTPDKNCSIQVKITEESGGD